MLVTGIPCLVCFKCFQAPTHQVYRGWEASETFRAEDPWIDKHTQQPLFLHIFVSVPLSLTGHICGRAKLHLGCPMCCHRRGKTTDRTSYTTLNCLCLRLTLVGWPACRWHCSCHNALQGCHLAWTSQTLSFPAPSSVVLPLLFC